MENPEEVLHSLEEFTKMKPKDIPRELEEYLKFVAKTGDPIYQWPAIKSLFREKFINVITEFYESCTSMEIPPCPNVEMFNYDLMKNFILEKIDTFPSAPFTLQRISELLTSPRKEYTRIDKYMRALEKNILVVSTMEPGGRRTENGEGIMNGIESDHDIVPEPANEINVVEMDDSPYVQTTSNHIIERISFENPKIETHSIEIETSSDTFVSEKITSEATTSSQEIVCVQYVSIEPVVDDNNTPNIIDDTKDVSVTMTDVSFTFTAINTKDDNPITPQIIVHEEQPTESIILTAEDVTTASSEALTESIIKPDPLTEPDVNMDTESVESTSSDSSGEPLKIETSSETLLEPISEAAPTTTVPELPDKVPLDQPQVISDADTVDTAPENSDSENVSPEDSVTSSDSSPCESSGESNASVEASVEVPSSTIESLIDNSVKESVENQEEQATKKEETAAAVEKTESDVVVVVDSTTKTPVENVKCEEQIKSEAVDTIIEVSLDIPLEAETKAVEIVTAVVLPTMEADDDDDDITTSEAIIDTITKSDVITAIAEEELVQPKPDEKGDVSVVTAGKKDKETVIIEPTLEVSSSASEEKETPMEVDAVTEETSDTNSKEKSPTTKEPDASKEALSEPPPESP